MGAPPGSTRAGLLIPEVTMKSSPGLRWACGKGDPSGKDHSRTPETPLRAIPVIAASPPHAGCTPPGPTPPEEGPLERRPPGDEFSIPSPGPTFGRGLVPEKSKAFGPSGPGTRAPGHVSTIEGPGSRSIPSCPMEKPFLRNAA